MKEWPKQIIELTKERNDLLAAQKDLVMMNGPVMWSPSEAYRNFCLGLAHKNAVELIQRIEGNNKDANNERWAKNEECQDGFD